MIMKANKQIGFIYKNEESIDKILKDGDVVFERGFLREKTSTTLPITFGGVGKDLKDYRVYGNTYQNSTKGINIYNVHNTKVNVSNEVEILSNDYVNCTYDNTNGSTIHYSNFMIAKTPQLQLSTNYLVVCEIQSVSGTGSLYPFTKHANSCINTQHTLYRFSNLSEGQKLLIPVTTVSSFTGTSSDLRTLIRFDAGQSGSITFRLSLLTDTTVTSDTFEYEPYTGGQPSPNPDYPQEIVSCGDLIIDTTDVNYGKYKIPVNVRSENLFDKDDINIEDNKYLTSDGSYFGNSNFKVTDYIPIKSNTIYNLSPYRNYSAYECFYDENKTFISSIQISSINNTFTTPSNAKFIRLSVRKSDNDVLTLVEDSITNIYLNEPLRKIGDYSDYIDFKNGKIIRQLGEITLDGNEDIVRNNTNTTGKYRFSIGITNANMMIVSSSSTTSQILSNRFLPSNRDNSYNNINGICYGTGSSTYKNLIIYGESLSLMTVENFKTWLQSNNVIVDYVLETPTEESITLPNIPTIDGNNTLNIETEITPSKVYIKYKSNT